MLCAHVPACMHGVCVCVCEREKETERVIDAAADAG